MTKDKKAKKIARLHAAAFGGSYTAARRATAQRRFLTVYDLLSDSVADACDGLVDRDVADLGSVDLDLQLPPGSSDAYVYGVEAKLDTLVNHPVEKFEGGTEISHVHVHAEVIVAAIVSKGDATTLDASGLVDVLDWDYNRHYAQVAFTTPQVLQFEFDATYTLDAESLDDLRFSGASNVT